MNTLCFAQQFPTVLANLSANYATILERLRRAAPDAEIVTLGLYNPFAVVDPSTNVVAETVNELIQEVASTYRARFANPFLTFNLSTPVLCTLTLVCTFGDIHPSNLGYQVLANVIWDASGYARFED